MRYLLLLAFAVPFAPRAFATETVGPASAKALSPIATRAPYCFQADPERDECVIGFENHQVTSTTNLVKLQITVGGRRVVEDRAFFQSSLFLGFSHIGRPGYKVACGLSGSGGDSDPLIGQRYNFQIFADDSDGASTQNFGTIGCPAFIPRQLFRDGFESD